MQDVQLKSLEQLQKGIEDLKKSTTIDLYKKEALLEVANQMVLILSQDTIHPIDIVRLGSLRVEFYKITSWYSPKHPPGRILHGKPEGELAFPNFKKVN